jgi:hypothetical protein
MPLPRRALGRGRCRRTGQIPLMRAAILLTLGDTHPLRDQINAQQRKVALTRRAVAVASGGWSIERGWSLSIAPPTVVAGGGVNRDPPSAVHLDAQVATCTPTLRRPRARATAKVNKSAAAMMRQPSSGLPGRSSSSSITRSVNQP